MMSIFTKPKFKKIIIIGLGLIGGSIAKACRAKKIGDRICAYDLDKSQSEFALNNQIIDEIYNFNQKILGESLVIIASPLSSYEEVAEKISNQIDDKVLITDVGSVKYWYEKQEIIPIFGSNAKNYVTCHPIAGSEKSGIVNADANLFLNKKLIISPFKETKPDIINKLSHFWKTIGCDVTQIPTEEHDKIFALVSHLPQFLAFIREEAVFDSEIIRKHLRLQVSNRKLWDEIFLLNKKNLDHYLKLFLENLQTFEKVDFEQKIAFLKRAEMLLNLPEEKLSKDELSQVQWRWILKRIILVASFVNIEDIKKFKIHSGSGFMDFTAILSYVKSVINNSEIIKQNQDLPAQVISEIKLKM